MSCDAVAAAAFLFLASAHPAPYQPLLHIDAPTAPHSVAKEPLFMDIVKRAGQLKDETDDYRKELAKASGSAMPLPKFDDFQARIAALSDLDMKGHLQLAKTGEDGDLKCILRGISQDLPRKLAELTSAKTAPDQATALSDMFYLLRDNVEVITSPPGPAA